MVLNNPLRSTLLSGNRKLWAPPIRRRLIPNCSLVRNSSSRAQPHVLEKPEKFNPPSHGSRLRNPSIRYYGPQMTAEELAQQRIKKYPNMMPPEGTFMHWFLHNKLIHLWLSLGILTSLAVTVIVTNFKRESPFADMLPDWYSLFLHPIRFWRTIIEVIKLDTARVSAEAAEKRKHRVDDVAKRAAFRKAQGLDQYEGIGGWTLRANPKNPDPEILAKSENDLPGEIIQAFPDEVPKKRPLKKWFGIW
ncbi:hypothetical protein EPUL_000668, partial [Erysiphe pulchra]